MVIGLEAWVGDGGMLGVTGVRTEAVVAGGGP